MSASFLDRFDVILVIISLRYVGWDLDGGPLELCVSCAQNDLLCGSVRELNLSLIPPLTPHFSF